MTTDLIEAPAPVAVTSDQLALIKRTVAAGASDEELKLFLYDCQRRNVHPLDRLIHFTKRGGKYTPITSIDFMRSRAHDTKECAGISDPTFTGEPKQAGFSAYVVVRRLVQGHSCPFEATARWEEYCPPAGQDHMWKRMAHVMLGKCAEALALRKAFPHQLSGLYASEEMDQAGAEREQGYRPPVAGALPEPELDEADESNEEGEPLPDGYVYVEEVKTLKTGQNNRGEWTLIGVVVSTGEEYKTFDEKVAEIATRCRVDGQPVHFELKANNVDIKSIHPLE